MSMTSFLRGQTLKKDEFKGQLKESLSQRMLQKRELGMPLVFFIAGSEVVMKKQMFRQSTTCLGTVNCS